MSSSLIAAAVAHVLSVAEGESGAAINPYVVGAIVLSLLVAALVALVVFGGGREHS